MNLDMYIYMQIYIKIYTYQKINLYRLLPSLYHICGFKCHVTHKGFTSRINASSHI